MTTVSVVIPTRGGPGVVAAVRSALAQTGIPVEVIVVVNGQAELPTFTDARIGVLRSPTEGRGNGARQAGIAAATGEFVALLDDDDRWEPTKLSQQVSLLRELEQLHGGRWIVSCRMLERATNGRTTTRPSVVPNIVDDPAAFLFRRPRLRSSMPHLQTSSLLFRREVGLLAPFRSEVRFHQDWTWALEAARIAGCRFAFVPESLVVRDIAVGRMSGAITWRQSLDWGTAHLRDTDARTQGDYLLVFPSYKAAREGSPQGVLDVLQAGLRRGRPGLPAMLFCIRMLLRAARRRGQTARLAGEPVFVRATGQAENVGDSLLRRPYLNALRRLGPLHILVRTMPNAYLDGLSLQPGDRVYESERRWLLAAGRSSLVRRTHFAFNAGEIRLDRLYGQQYLSYLPIVLAIRIRGGRALQLGTGVQPSSSRWGRVVGFVSRRVHTVGWRDPQSRALMSTGRVMPDWAFAEGAPSSNELFLTGRPLLTISMRGDRPAPRQDWYDAIRASAAEHGLELVVVVQVERDSLRARELAARLPARLEDWHGGPRRAREQALRAIYSKSDIVVSDRLHVLVMAFTEGSVPIGLAENAAKIQRHFAAVEMPWVAQELTEAHPPERSIAAVLDRRGEMAGLLAAARTALADVASNLSGAASHRDR